MRCLYRPGWSEPNLCTCIYDLPYEVWGSLLTFFFSFILTKMKTLPPKIKAGGILMNVEQLGTMRKSARKTSCLAKKLLIASN